MLQFATINGHVELAKFLILQGADRTARVYKTHMSNQLLVCLFIWN
jgi:hypothetical protein